MASDRVKSGCLKYAHATVDIYFPDGKVCCDICPLMHGYQRKQCARTGEYLMDTSITTGMYCPLKITEVKEIEKRTVH